MGDALVRMLLAGCLVSSSWYAEGTPSTPEFGRAAFVNSRDPPSFGALKPAEAKRFDLGHAIFNTHFVAAGLPHAARRDGLGPLFNASACDACHNEGAHGRGPVEDGPLPSSLVIELAAPTSSLEHPAGDPHYGRTFNTAALDGFDSEGVASVHYTERSGHYRDGEAWHLRVPRYELSELHYGALAADTVLQPRLAPALFGAGLLELVPHAEPGRFGWQNTARSLADQTAQALSRDMGLSSPLLDHDDCTSVQTACRQAPSGGTPEIDAEYLDALIAFQRNLAVPARTHPNTPAGASLFTRLGCSACHTAAQQVTQNGVRRTLWAYSDLRRHDMGQDLADHREDGSAVSSRFRSAPLWGMGYRLKMEQFPTFLHDGRARSLAEAILWHGGEAGNAREKFEASSAHERRLLIEWLGGL